SEGLLEAARKEAKELSTIRELLEVERKASASLEERLHAAETELNSLQKELKLAQDEAARRQEVIEEYKRLPRPVDQDVLKNELADAVLQRATLAKAVDEERHAFSIREERLVNEILGLKQDIEQLSESKLVLAAQEKKIGELEEEIKVMNHLLFDVEPVEVGVKRRRVDNDTLENENSKLNVVDTVVESKPTSDVSALKEELGSLRAELRDCYTLIEYYQEKSNDALENEPPKDENIAAVKLECSDENHLVLEVELYAKTMLLAEKENEIATLRNALTDSLDENKMLSEQPLLQLATDDFNSVDLPSDAAMNSSDDVSV
ncbi:hypothetical protein HDU67_002231, partial [Dinochytrium kinnereticum]